MIINDIVINNFKSITNMKLFCSPTMNLFLGINGAGKSTILDAIADSLSWYMARCRNKNANGVVISERDINTGASECQLKIAVENPDISWSLYRKKSYSRSKTAQRSDFSALSKHFDEQQVNELTSTPVIAYYGVNRIVESTPSRFRKRHQFNLFDTYIGALSAGANFRQFFEWFKEREDLENENLLYGDKQKDNQLEAVRSAILSIMPDYKQLRVRRNPNRVVLTKNDTELTVDQFSDGEKCYLTLFADIARRLAIANPQTTLPLEGKGIILIDEIDLHLHPLWQTEVLSKLRSTFPNCQFFITTHSPLVISAINNHKNEKLFAIQNGEIVHSSEQPYGKTVEDILRYYFELNTTRNIEVQNYFSKLETLLSNNQYNTDEFEKIFSWLKEHLGTDDKDILRYEMEKRRRLLNAKNK